MCKITKGLREEGRRLVPVQAQTPQPLARASRGRRIDNQESSPPIPRCSCSSSSTSARPDRLNHKNWTRCTPFAEERGSGARVEPLKERRKLKPCNIFSSRIQWRPRREKKKERNLRTSQRRLHPLNFSFNSNKEHAETQSSRTNEEGERDER